MAELGLTQDQLAERLGVTQGGLGHWLNGRRKPDIDTINRILEEVGYPSFVIREGSDPAPAKRDAGQLSTRDAYEQVMLMEYRRASPDQRRAALAALTSTPAANLAPSHLDRPLHEVVPDSLISGQARRSDELSGAEEDRRHQNLGPPGGEERRVKQ